MGTETLAGTTGLTGAAPANLDTQNETAPAAASASASASATTKTAATATAPTGTTSDCGAHSASNGPDTDLLLLRQDHHTHTHLEQNQNATAVDTELLAMIEVAKKNEDSWLGVQRHNKNQTYLPKFKKGGISPEYVEIGLKNTY